MNPTSLLLDCITRTIRSIENPAAHISLALAPKATCRPNIGRARPVRVRAAVPALPAEASTAPASSSTVMGRAEHSDDPLARSLGFVAGARSRRRFRIAP